MADLSTERFDHYLTFGVAASRKDRSADPASTSHAEAITDTYELYAQSELTLNDRLTINTGLRIDHQKISPKSTFTAATETTTATAIEPQIAALYRLNDNWNVFGSLSRVNRLPTDDEIYDAFSGGLPNLDLKAEKGMNYEIGVSYSGQGLFRADDAVDFKLTAFYNDIEDKIIRTGGGAGVIGFGNIDSAIIKGIEAEGRYVAGRFSASAGLSVLDGEGPDGAKLDTIANNTLTLGFGYQLMPELKIGINSVFAADRSQSRGEYDGYTVHNIYATYIPDHGALEGLEVRLGVDNIANATYQPATYLSQSAKGRNFKLSLAKTF